MSVKWGLSAMGEGGGDEYCPGVLAARESSRCWNLCQTVQPTEDPEWEGIGGWGLQHAGG